MRKHLATFLKAIPAAVAGILLVSGSTWAYNNLSTTGGSNTTGSSGSGSGSVGTLQQVTDLGSVTTNRITAADILATSSSTPSTFGNIAYTNATGTLRTYSTSFAGGTSYISGTTYLGSTSRAYSYGQPLAIGVIGGLGVIAGGPYFSYGTICVNGDSFSCNGNGGVALFPSAIAGNPTVGISPSKTWFMNTATGFGTKTASSTVEIVGSHVVMGNSTTTLRTYSNTFVVPTSTGASIYGAANQGIGFLADNQSVSIFSGSEVARINTVALYLESSHIFAFGPHGTEAAPFLADYSYQGTGLWFSGDSSLNVSAGGVKRLAIGTTSSTFSVPINVSDTATSTFAGKISLPRIVFTGLTASPAGINPVCVDATGETYIGSSSICPLSALSAKEDLKPASYGLPQVLATDFYDFKTVNGDDRIHTGPIADYTDKIMPNLTEWRDGKINGFDYLSFTGVLGQALKDLNAKVEAQQREINELHAQLLTR